MRARYDVINIGGATRTAGKTVLLLTAGTLPLHVLMSSVEVEDQATSYQLRCSWKKVSSFSPTPAGQGVTTITKTREFFPGEGFTAIGDITAEPSYDAAVVRETHSGPSVIGYHSHLGPEPEDVVVEPTDSWGLVVDTAGAFGASLFTVTVLAEEG